MKYIRTKDGIYKYVKKIRNYYYECDGFIDDEKKVHCFIVFKPKDILKKADTIKELCDIFVIKYFSHITKKYEYEHLETLKQLENYCWEENDEYYIYGAIWTDKGLIYVAKMNEKGELELL